MKEKIAYGNFEANLNFLMNNSLISKDDKILEIGSGKGVLLNYLYKKGYNIIGNEADKSFYKKAKELFGNDLPIYLTKGTKLDFEDNSFDVVISFDVFEHIKDVDKHLQEIKKILKPRGRYLLGTPNKWTNIPWEILQSKSLKYKEYHCSLHNYWQLKRRFQKNNFKVKFIKVPIINNFTLSKIKEKIGETGLFLFKIINPDKLPLPLRTNFYIITGCKK